MNQMAKIVFVVSLSVAGSALAAPLAKPPLPAKVAKRVEEVKRDMMKDIKDDTTPFLNVVPLSASVEMKLTREGDYDTGEWQTYQVHQITSDGVLHVKALLPVSAHTGEAEKFAKTNRYNMVIEHADGTTETLPQVRSTGLITERDLAVKLTAGSTKLMFWPDDPRSSVGGYAAGRVVEFVYGGKK